MKLKYTVQAAKTQFSLESLGCDCDSQHDTLAEATERAKYYLTTRFADVCETYQTLGYSRVINNKTGEIISDYFAENAQID